LLGIRVDLGQGPVTGSVIPHISQFKRDGKVIGFVTNLGLGGEGKRRRQFDKERSQAERFLNDHVRTTFDPLNGRRHEVLLSLERVDRMGVSINDVVKFYRAANSG